MHTFKLTDDPKQYSTALLHVACLVNVSLKTFQANLFRKRAQHVRISLI